MRTKDDIKQEALFEATVKLVNEIGFAASSVAKIAREANISPATIYVYHKNKEDLLVSTYVEIKRNFGAAVTGNVEYDLPIRDCLRCFWFNLFEYALAHPDYFQYAEQFSNSPYNALVDKKQVEQYFEPMFHVVSRGISQKIIKDVEFDILGAFFFFPAMALSNRLLCRNFQPTPENIETAFNLAWDAIKL